MWFTLRLQGFRSTDVKISERTTKYAGQLGEDRPKRSDIYNIELHETIYKTFTVKTELKSFSVLVPDVIALLCSEAVEEVTPTKKRKQNNDSSDDDMSLGLSHDEIIY